MDVELPASVRDLVTELRACALCKGRFAATATCHAPRPVSWFRPTARLLVAGQAPGARVHASGVPFDDASGDRLRDWMGVTRDQFYDLDRVAVVPMAFCFPGYDAKGAELQPTAICARTWRARVMAVLPQLRLRLLIGGGWRSGCIWGMGLSRRPWRTGATRRVGAIFRCRTRRGATPAGCAGTPGSRPILCRNCRPVWPVR